MTQMTGRCMCGETTYETSGNPSAAHACHCDDCQRFTGTAFVGVDFETLEISGAVKWFKSSQWGERGSCSNCGSAMFWRLQNGSGPKVVSIGSLDEADSVPAIDKHYFADNIPPAFNFTGDAVRMSREETLTLFESLIDV